MERERDTVRGVAVEVSLNLGSISFLAPLRGLVVSYFTHPRPTPWALFFRRFAAVDRRFTADPKMHVLTSSGDATPVNAQLFAGDSQHGRPKGRSFHLTLCRSCLRDGPDLYSKRREFLTHGFFFSHGD